MPMEPCYNCKHQTRRAYVEKCQFDPLNPVNTADVRKGDCANFADRRPNAPAVKTTVKDK